MWGFVVAILSLGESDRFAEADKVASWHHVALYSKRVNSLKETEERPTYGGSLNNLVDSSPAPSQDSRYR